MRLKHKLALALTAYAVIAVLAWQTLTEPRLRAFVLVVMAFFAVKSLLYWRREVQRERDESASAAKGKGLNRRFGSYEGRE